MGTKSKDADFVQFKENLVKVYVLLSGVPRLGVAKFPETLEKFMNSHKSQERAFYLYGRLYWMRPRIPQMPGVWKLREQAAGCSLHMLAVYEYFPSVTIKWLKTICIFSSWLHCWPSPAIANQAVSFVPCIITMKTLEPEVSWQFSWWCIRQNRAQPAFPQLPWHWHIYQLKTSERWNFCLSCRLVWPGEWESWFWKSPAKWISVHVQGPAHVGSEDLDVPLARRDTVSHNRIVGVLKNNQCSLLKPAHPGKVLLNLHLKGPSKYNFHNISI